MNFADIVWDLQTNPMTQDVEEIKQAKLLALGVRETFDLKNVFERKRTIKKLPIKNAEEAWFRVSSLPYLCPREEVICSLHDIVREESTLRIDGMVFGLGTMVHSLMQNGFFGPEKVLIGNWKCIKCGDVVEDSVMPSECKKCGNKDVIVFEYELGAAENAEDRYAFEFVESIVRDEAYKVKGHIDGVVLVQGKKYLTDFKTIRGDLFAKLTEPYESHIQQISVYGHMANFKETKIVYINKGGRNSKDFWKEFTVPVIKSDVDKQLAKTDIIRSGIKEKKLPSRDEVCLTASSYRAKKCAACKICFANKE